MKTEEVIALVNAGYTKEEILKMEEPKKEPKEEPKKEPKEEPKKEPKEEPKKEPKEEPKKEPKEEPKNDVLKALEESNAINKELSELIKQMQADNRNSARQEPEKKLSADDVIRNFIEQS